MRTTEAPPFRKPSRRLYRSEPPRALAELARFWAAYPILASPASGPLGDGRGVLVLPGFMAGDESTTALRRLLVARGYEARPWGLGRNLGPTARVLGSLDPLLRRLADETTGPVSVVGWSLGGIFARGLAARHPDLVRNVITLAAPLRVTAVADNRDMTRAGALYHSLRRLHSRESWLPDEVLDNPPPVPSSALYSVTDGIVPWSACMEFEGPRAQSIEVRSSHLGMGHSVAAVPIVLDVLARPEGRWEPNQGRPGPRLP